MRPERWTDAKITCATNALGDALREGVGILVGIFEDVETKESFIAVFQHMTQKWIRHHAADFTIEWCIFVDCVGEGEYAFLTGDEENFAVRTPALIDGRKVVLLCAINYDYAEEPR